MLTEARERLPPSATRRNVGVRPTPSGSAAGAGYKHVALGPIPLECTSEGFQEYRKDLEQALCKHSEDPDEAHIVFWVLPEAARKIVRGGAQGRALRK